MFDKKNPQERLENVAALTLFSTCSSGGCGAKIGPNELTEYLTALPAFADPNLMVGFEASDDAAVYQISPDTAIVSTVDFFPPMVDDPYLFGKIAAANALSDVYAMGGRPLFALNLVTYPQKADKALLGEILRGGADKLKEAGVALGGGHSIYDHEPKYGLAVTGVVDPDKIWHNNSCAAGDALILTKALGVGLVMAAARGGEATDAQYQAAVASMERLNKYAAEKLAGYSINAVTDVTGFGLAVHAVEMAGTEHSLIINADSLPSLPGALDFASAYLSTAASIRNRDHMEGRIDLGAVSEPLAELIFDPQTSGGLLISLPAAEAEKLLAGLNEVEPAARIIGLVAAREACSLIIL